MNKYEIVEAVEGMGFRLERDYYDDPQYNLMKFVVNHDELKDDDGYWWYWYKDKKLAENLAKGAKILFQAGQKIKIAQFNRKITNLL